MERKLWTEPFDARIVAEGLALAHNDVAGIRNGRGALVFVESGTAWITQEHDRRDLLVPAGKTFRLDRDGVALVQAHRAATITITAPLDAAAPEVYRVGAPQVAAPHRHRAHRMVRRMWAIVLRLYRRHAPPRAWEIRLDAPHSGAAACLAALDPIGPDPRRPRDAVAALRAAISLETSRFA